MKNKNNKSTEAAIRRLGQLHNKCPKALKAFLIYLFSRTQIRHRISLFCVWVQLAVVRFTFSAVGC